MATNNKTTSALANPPMDEQSKKRMEETKTFQGQGMRLDAEQRKRYDAFVKQGKQAEADKYRLGIFRGKGPLGTAPVDTPTPEERFNGSYYDAGTKINNGAGEIVDKVLGSGIDQKDLPDGSWMSSPEALNNQRQMYADKAYDWSTRRMGEQQGRELADFRERMANEGVPETSEKYQYLQKQIMQGQEDARTSARDSSWLNAGQDVNMYGNMTLNSRGQMFGERQAIFEAPLKQASAMSPYYGEMGANYRMGQQQQYDMSKLGKAQEYTQDNMRLEQDNALARIKATPRGGGSSGPGYDVFALENLRSQNDMKKIYAQQIMNGMGSGDNGSAFGSGFSSGIGTGATIGLSGIGRR